MQELGLTAGGRYLRQLPARACPVARPYPMFSALISNPPIVASSPLNGCCLLGQSQRSETAGSGAEGGEEEGASGGGNGSGSGQSAQDWIGNWRDRQGQN